MAEQTLLQMTQTILAALDSDVVNSISDTVESMQVANIIQNKYYDILTRGNLPENNVLLQLNPSDDATKPVLMFRPMGVAKLEWIKYFDVNPKDSQQISQFGSYSHGLNTDLVITRYWSTSSSSAVAVGTGSKTFVVAASSNSLPVVLGQGVTAKSGANILSGTVTSYSGTTLILNITSFVGTDTPNNWTITNNVTTSIPGYKYVTMTSVDEFLGMTNRFNPAESNVRSYSFTEGPYSFTFYYKNDRQPQYCTIIENYYILFDSYDNTFDDTLQASKTLAYGNFVAPFQLTDNFIPDLDDNQFPLLVSEAKSLAFFELKQMMHPKADQEIKRQWSTVQKNKSVANKPSYFEQLPDMGRVPRTGGFAGGGYGAYKWMRQSGP